MPKPYDFLDALLMELWRTPTAMLRPSQRRDAEPDEARRHHAFLIRQIVAMLCAGLVHGDLSEFNVLLGPTPGDHRLAAASTRPQQPCVQHARTRRRNMPPTSPLAPNSADPLCQEMWRSTKPAS
ncbi:RIO1 family regulatory kinase/ATPase [Pseudomonas aeruginosa]|uniref:RIO1 family regulatory kinase/ATPase domain-containing protein n=1 Tax=Pseudomonas aeruginosa TaxID=287 RepID=UPI001E539335|nr:RIO1 family regulatory kinase/ATPase [Pseudomonas aeruginosa]